ncbi:MAG: hypothetical protein R6V59_07925 [Dehalococcoidia bacterium]
MSMIREAKGQTTGRSRCLSRYGRGILPLLSFTGENGVSHYDEEWLRKARDPGGGDEGKS